MGVDLHGLPFVETSLQYLSDNVSSPVNYLGVEPPAGEPALFPKDDVSVRCYDARPVQDQFDLDKYGVILCDNRVAGIDNYYDDHQIKQVYYPSLEKLIKKVTGAKFVIVFDHTYRSSDKNQHGEMKINPAVEEVHNDYTNDSGPERIREMTLKYAPDMDVDELMTHRYAIYNAWRSINGVIEEKPLAVCDMQSMKADDFVPCVLKWPHRTGYVTVVRHHDRHRWFYFSGMDEKEVLLFKCYDSEAINGLRFTCHSAFNDPESPMHSRVRESIEARVITFY